MPPDGYSESQNAYRLCCPSGKCGDAANFILSRINGSGICLNEPLLNMYGYRRYSPWEIARLLGFDVYGLYGLFTGARPVSLLGTDSASAGESLRDLRVDSTDIDSTAKKLLHDPWLTHRFLVLASASGIAGEEDLLRILYLAVTSRLIRKHRFHVSLGEQSAAGKSELARFVLSVLPSAITLHLGGGASKRAFQYVDDLSHQVVFIDEADVLDEDVRALLREAVTQSQVNRLVTKGDPSAGFTTQRYTSKTEGMVLIQAGTRVITDPADETRFLVLHPDVSREQTSRILDKQAEQVTTLNPVALETELQVWQKAQEFLQPCHVVIPYARELRRFFPSEMVRVRRDFPRLLSLIGSHACLHQFQRSCYEHDGHFIVVAEVEDYCQVYEFAASLFSQATKRLTPTQDEVAKAIRANVDLDEGFTATQAKNWSGKGYTTVWGHLEALESLHMVESASYRGKRMWRFIADDPPGLSIPTPDELINALHQKTPKIVFSHAYAEAKGFTDSDTVTSPKTPKMSSEFEEKWKDDKPPF